jgi:hypothetical protein
LGSKERMQKLDAKICSEQSKGSASWKIVSNYILKQFCSFGGVG